MTKLLDDGTGQIRPELMPLFDTLVTMDNPLTGLTWLYRPHVPRFLGGLGAGIIPLTHEAFDQLQPWRAGAYLRELLMSRGLLPAIDKQVLLFERWLANHLRSLDDRDQARIIRQFTTWQVSPKLRAKADRGALPPSARRTAGAQVMSGTEFLAWLSTHELTLATCTQDALDRWRATHRGHQRTSTRSFLTWAMHTRRMPRLQIPLTPTPRRPPITQHHRLRLLRKLLVEDELDLLTRVAAILVLLYAQPFSRIVQLTVDDILTTGEEILIRFGQPPTPVPEPFAPLILRLRDQRPNMRTATNPNSRWLFPGRRPGQPLHPATLGNHVASAGLPSTPGRVAALRQLVLQAPAPVIADALGIHYTTAHHHLAEAGGTWKTCAPGDHSQ